MFSNPIDNKEYEGTHIGPSRTYLVENHRIHRRSPLCTVLSVRSRGDGDGHKQKLCSRELWPVVARFKRARSRARTFPHARMFTSIRGSSFFSRNPLHPPTIIWRSKSYSARMAAHSGIDVSPPVMRGMEKLDRSAFRRSVPVLAARVSPAKTAELLRAPDMRKCAYITSLHHLCL